MNPANTTPSGTPRRSITPRDEICEQKGNSTIRGADDCVGNAMYIDCTGVTVLIYMDTLQLGCGTCIINCRNDSWKSYMQLTGGMKSDSDYDSTKQRGRYSYSPCS